MNNMQTTKQNVENLLVEKKLVTADQIDKAKVIQAQTLERLEDILIRLGFLTEKQILDVWAEFLGISVVDLTNIKVDAKLLSFIPEYQAKQYKMVPYKKEGNKLTIVMADPFDIMATDMLAFLTQCKLEVLIAPKNQIDLAIRQLYSWEGFSVADEESPKQDDIQQDERLEIVRKTSEQGAVVQFLNAIFKQAILKRASDIHVEPREDMLLVRFRIDGKLHDALTGPKSLIAPLISRIKILSHMDIAERRLPQDGRLKVKMQDNDVDFRVSTVPGLIGEKAVLRLLQRESKFDLDNLGFADSDIKRLKEILDEPYGLILVTGPTGAGKTTTLFGMLKYFNSSEINIFTIENPVEYRISGITQVQINEKIGLDFASGLRSALRQDPDIILVGEIRDIDTAEIAFRASLTGHKVLSTLHTNNATASVNRLINMGVPAYLVNAALRIAVAQKLLHRICPHCKTEYRPNPSIVERLNINPSKIIATKFYKGVGCKECNQTGTIGRLGVYETMLVTPSIREAVINEATDTTIKRIARLEGMRTLRELAIDKAFAGETTFEEILYITPSDDEEKKIPVSSLMPASTYQLVMPPEALSVAQTQPESNTESESQTTFDLNDPLTQSIVKNLERDYLFLSDEKLALNIHLPVEQVVHLLELNALTRDVENFVKQLGKAPNEFDENAIHELLELISEKHGTIPSFIFEDPDSASKWSTVAIKNALTKLKGRLEKPEDLPELFKHEFIIHSGLEQVYSWLNNSRFKMIDLAMPGKFKPWHFSETEEWLANNTLSHCAREAIEWIVEKKLDSAHDELPTKLTKEFFEQIGLSALLEKFDNSFYKLVNNVFPDLFKPWQFPDEEAVIWFQDNSKDIATQATKWLVEEKLGISAADIPKRITVRDFHTNGLSKLLDLFNQNLFDVIENAYPELFKPWQFNEQHELWKSSKAIEIAKEATKWLITEKLAIDDNKALQTLSRRHFINNGLGFMLGVIFNHSHFLALENAIPELISNEIFQSSLLKYSQEIGDLSRKWEAVAEKIAISHFGKNRFKVTLPNLQVAPIVPEYDRIYLNAANQIEYVPQIIIPKLNAYADFSDFASWVPYCDRLTYWVLGDDRAPNYAEPTHPKIKLVFVESLFNGLRSKGLLDLVEKIQQLLTIHTRLLNQKAPAGTLE